MTAFFSSMAGSFIALLGVVLTLRANQKTFEKNLKEEREKTERDREYSAKLNAFMKASESVTRFISFYTTLPDRELPKDGSVQEEVTSMSVSMNALHFFCGVETIRRATSLSMTLSIAFSEAVKLKLPTMFLDEDIKSIDRNISWLENSIETAKQEISALLISDPSSTLVKFNREQIAINSQKIIDLCDKKREFIKEKYAATEKCRDIIINSLQNVYVGVQEVLLIAREELGFQINPEQYSTIISESTAGSLASLNSLLQEVRGQVLEKMR